MKIAFSVKNVGMMYIMEKNNLYQITVECEDNCPVIYDNLFQSDNIEKVKGKAQEIINGYILDEYHTLKDADDDGVKYKAFWTDYSGCCTHDDEVIGYWCEHLESSIIIRTINNIEEL